MKIWKLHCPVPPCDHAFKYSLVYVLEGKRIVGFDNERGKGDHKHLDGKEHVYRFVSIDQLLDEFLAEVEMKPRSADYLGTNGVRHFTAW